MSYPASTVTLQQWVRDIDNKVHSIKVAAQTQHALSLASNLDINSIRGFFDAMVQANQFLISAAAVTGLAAYVNTEKQGQVADAVAELAAVRTQIVATLDWLRANVPQGSFGGQDYKLAYLFPAGNATQSSLLKVTSAQSAGYRTVLNALIATVG